MKNTITVTATPDFEMIASIRTHYYALIKYYENAEEKAIGASNKVSLVKFDGNHNVLFSKDIIPEEGSSFLCGRMAGDHFKFFFRGPDQDGKKGTAIYVQNIGLEGNESSVPVQVVSQTPPKKGLTDWYIETSKDGNFVLSHGFKWNGAGKNRLYTSESFVAVMNKDNKLIGETTIGKLLKDQKGGSFQVLPNGDGQVAILWIGESSAKANPVLLAEWNPETGELRKSKMDFKGCADLRLHAGADFYSVIGVNTRYKKDADVGLKIIQTDRETFLVSEPVSVNLNNTQVGDYIVTTEDFDTKGKELPMHRKFAIDLVESRSQKEIQVRLSEYTADRYDEQTVLTGSHALIRLNSNGTLKWQALVPRKNTGTNTMLDYAEVMELEAGNKEYLIFNDIPENQKISNTDISTPAKALNAASPKNALVAWVSLNGTDGAASKGVINDIQNTERALFFAPSAYCIMDGGRLSLCMWGAEKNKVNYKFGVLYPEIKKTK